jgi:hypothetical protein
MTAGDDPGFHYQLGIELFIDGVLAAARRVTGG